MNQLQEIFRDETSVLSSIGGLKILQLKGDPLERARAHGRLLKSHLSTSVLDYFIGKLEEPFQSLPGPLQTAAVKGVGKLIRGLHADLPQALRFEVAALADGAGIKENTLTAALSAPDLGTLMNAWQMSPSAAWARLRFGCTSASAGSETTGFSLARNLDFAGVGSYDAHPLVVAHLPDASSGELKRISIAADGVHFASISGMNEHGIGLVVHMNYSRVNTAKSWPLLFVGDWILRQAKTLDEAETILKASRPGPLWTFVLFDMHKGETRSCEVSKDHFGVRKAKLGDVFAQANHCTAEGTSELEHSPHSTNQNSVCRFKNASAGLSADQSLEERREVLAKMLTQAASDVADEPSLFDDIVKPLTIQSMIFERAPGRSSIDFFLSIDPAPSSTGRYAKLSLDRLLDSKMTPLEAEIHDFEIVTEKRRENDRRIAKAFHLSFDERQDAEALDQVREMTSHGVLLLKAVLAGRSKKWTESLEYVDAALQRQVPPYIRASLLWIKTVALDRLDDRAGSRAAAQLLSDEQPENLFWAEAAKRVAKGYRPRAHEAALTYDFFAGDLLTPPQAFAPAVR